MSGITPTPEQVAIVNHPLDQPLRVAAGAGTGKTTTIALRLAYAVEAGEMLPEQALGLTFTNKAAEELAARLGRLLPKHTAEGRHVQVLTYHGFAWSLLSEFGAYAGIERDSRVIGPGYVRQLILETITTADRVDHLDLTALGHRTNEVSEFAAHMATSLVTADEVRQAAPDEPDEVWARRLDLTDLVDRFAARKGALGVVDYADLVATARSIVTDHPEVAMRVRDRYRIVLLDEYQDTDAGQRRLLQAIFGDGFPITAVGDTDQTIYAWRGASPANFDAFPHHFPDVDGDEAGTLPLTVNRRSGSRILALANDIRRQIHGPDLEGPLVPADGTGTGHLHLAYHDDARNEAIHIAETMRALHDEEGLAWSEMAVLFRTNARIPVVRGAMEMADIPHEVAALGGLLSVPDVADLHAWLTVLADAEATASLARILLGSRYRLGIGDLAPLARWAQTRNRLGDETELVWPLLEAIDRIDEVGDLRDEARDRLRRFRNEYAELLAAAQTRSLVELCRIVLDRTDAWTEIDGRQPAAALSARLNLFRFLDLAEEWSPLEGRPSLQAFLGYLATLEEDAGSAELDTATAGRSDAVSLLTVHRAKGLEWNTVFLPGLTSPGFPTRSRRFDLPYEFPTSLPYGLRVDADHLPALTGDSTDDRSALRRRHEVEELRTAYVAVTRSRERLYLSGAHHWGQSKPQPPSIIFELGRAVDGAEVDIDDPPPADPPDSTVLEVAAPEPDPVFSDGVARTMRAVAAGELDISSLLEAARVGATAYDAEMEQFRLMLEGLPDAPEASPPTEATSVSVTSLVTMAQCPRRYFWSEVDRLPRRPSAAARRGTEVHRRIELHHRGQMPLEEVDEVEYDAVPDENLEATVGSAMDRFLASEYADRRPLFIETPIDIALPSGRIRGRIDAVYGDAGTWEIVDFKSGRPDEDPTRSIQLEAYALAAAGGILGRPPGEMAVSFVFLGGDAAVARSQNVDEDWLDTARHRLDGLLATIGDAGTDREAFPTTPGDQCRRCDFVDHCAAGSSHVATG